MTDCQNRTADGTKTPSAAADRISAEAFAIEAIFGEKIPQCRQCGGRDLFEDYARSAWRCRTCWWIEAAEQVLWVPKDERVREAMGLV